MRLLYAFALAWNMLSIIPFLKLHTFFKGINGYSAMFYPLIGFILGAILWLMHSLLESFIAPTHLAVIIFSLWVLLTGALHLDGLSDTIDGLFVSKEHSLAVMKDSHVGGMGMLFSFVFLALKLSSLIHFEAFYLLPLILASARLNAVVAIFLFPYKSSGVGALLKEELTLIMVLFALAYTFVISLLFSFTFALFLSLLFGVLLGLLFLKRLGGLSGDMYGFMIEMSELLLLNTLIVSLSL